MRDPYEGSLNRRNPLSHIGRFIAAGTAVLILYPLLLVGMTYVMISNSRHTP